MTADQRTSLDRSILVPITREALPAVAIEAKMRLFQELRRQYPGNESVVAVLAATWQQRTAALN